MDPDGGARTSSGDGFHVQPPQLSLPTGGGAIRGIGEKFAANPVTGSCSFTIPIPAPPGRNDFGPQLALGYDSASGNGPFGFGWRLDLPAITRKTDKGLPRYDETDVFVLSGAEDLVPVLDAAGAVVDDRATEAGYIIRRYRPRIEGLFARIERWTRTADGDVHWRSLSPANVLTIYGRDDASRISDPADPRRTFNWLIAESRDDRGNAILYEYTAEDAQGVDLAQAHERHRGPATSPCRTANRHLSSIRYGNATSLLAGTPPERPTHLEPATVAATRWMFELAFDYGTPDPQDWNAIGPWTCRPDPFSTYRATFEVRTYRLCQRILVRHCFPDLENGAPTLVRSLDLSYRSAPSTAGASDPGFAFLAHVTLWSYQRAQGRWERRQRPPLAFRYSEATIDTQLREIDPTQLPHTPVGLGGAYQWVDLDGEGLPGILYQDESAWYFKPGRGSDGRGPRFGAQREVAPLPAMASGAEGRQQLLDLSGDGALALADLRTPGAGFHARDRDAGWGSFVPLRHALNVDWADPNLRFIDLTGDGRADVLVTQGDAHTWYASLGDEGFETGIRQLVPPDERDGPRLVFADADQSMFIADMSGDGLPDLVRVRHGSVCYWPNLGYGAFGKQVTMDHAPSFDHPDHFDPRRLRLADIDGSGTTDLIYLGREGGGLAEGAAVYANQSGNAWADARPLAFPVVPGPTDRIQVADLLGNGTACLVWSSDAPADARRPMRYLDLMGGTKPHLLVEMRNNLGAVSKVSYAPSTRFYLADLAAGQPWATALPFPVHCVTTVAVQDLHRKTTFGTTYTYHHGYFDGVEREFRGFARVEQVDTQAFHEFADANRASGYVSLDQSVQQPPVKTITWFHTGIAADRTRALGMLAHEYFPSRYASRLAAGAGAFVERVLPHPEMEPALPLTDGDEWREAMRACKGMVLREEVLELDLVALTTTGAHVPVRLITATQNSCNLQRVQPRGPNANAVFLAAPGETCTWHYDLDLTGTGPLDPDPRMAQTIPLRLDSYARAMQVVTVGYGRVATYREGPATIAPLTPAQVALIQRVQSEVHVVCTETSFARELSTADRRRHHRLPPPVEVKTIELTGITPAPETRYLTAERVREYRLNDTWDDAAPRRVGTLRYHERAPAPLTQAWRRTVEHVVTRYFDRTLTAALPFGDFAPHGMAREAYRLALTSSLLDAVLAPGAGEDDFPAEARAALDAPGAQGGFFASGYAPDTEVFGTGPAVDRSWWVRSGIAGFVSGAATRFLQPTRFTDPFGQVTTQTFDGDDYVVVTSTDAVGNQVSLDVLDHRVLAPARLTDANGNVTEVALDIHGLPVASAVLGKVDAAGIAETGNAVDAMTFAQLNPDAAAVARCFTSPQLDEVQVRRWLARASTRFVYHTGETIDAQGRVTWGVLPAGACSIVREQHERDAPNDDPDAGVAGVALQVSFAWCDGGGALFASKAQAEPDPAMENVPGAPSRWIANGKTVLNNKGKPVLQYEPWFSTSGPSFAEPVAAGTSAVTYYDAVGRTVRIDHPDGSVSRVAVAPWMTQSHDANDTVRDPGNRWYAERTAPGADPPARRSANLAWMHGGTPSEGHLDALGREVVSIAHNRLPDESQPPATVTTLADWPWRDVRVMTFTKLDAEGKALWICDGRGNRVMQYVFPALPVHTTLADAGGDMRTAYDMPSTSAPCYDIAGHLLFQRSMDAGDRRMLSDATGQPLLAWDYNERADATSTQRFKEHRRVSLAYDAVQRPVARRLRVRDGATGVVTDALVEAFAYGESAPAAAASNLRGQVWRHADSSGVEEVEAVDLTGKPQVVHRRLASDVTASIVDWAAWPVADLHAAMIAGCDDEVYTQRTAYDALGRIGRHYNWHVQRPARSGVSDRVTVLVPRYNRRGALQGEAVLVRARKTATGHDVAPGITQQRDAVTRIDYDAKGQRTRVERGNGTVTQYDYDPESLRLRAMRTTRPGYAPAFPVARGTLADARVLQHVHYVYDAVGNITATNDDAWDPAFFRNQQVEAESRFVYDAQYRVIEATGRENSAPVAHPLQLEDPASTQMPPVTTAGVLRNYRQRYRYDVVGNIVEMRHMVAAGGWSEPPGWTRRYRYAADSNRLLETWYGRTLDPALGRDNVRYAYDAHGSMLNLQATAPQFDVRWNADDMVHTIDLGGGGRVWYQYGVSKERCRKRITYGPDRNGTVKEERIALGGFERYRRYASTGAVVEEIESHHVFDGDQRVLLVDDVLLAGGVRPDGSTVRQQTCWRYQYGNHLGSVGLELDEAAAVISYEEYHPYGTAAYRLVDGARESPAKRYRYSGMERDEESGLNYHAARYLSCVLARWMSADPDGTCDGVNVYADLRGDPVRCKDPAGTQTTPVKAEDVKLPSRFYEPGALLGVCREVPDGSGPTIQADRRPLGRRMADQEYAQLYKQYVDYLDAKLGKGNYDLQAAAFFDQLESGHNFLGEARAYVDAKWNTPSEAELELPLIGGDRFEPAVFLGSFPETANTPRPSQTTSRPPTSAPPISIGDVKSIHSYESGLRHLSEMEGRYQGLNRTNVALALYDPVTGEVTLQVFGPRVGDQPRSVVFEQTIGVVQIPNLGPAPRGNAVEPPVRQLARNATGQRFPEKPANRPGPDLVNPALRLRFQPLRATTQRGRK